MAMTLLQLAACLWIAGFVIGLGAVSVIETLGFLGQRSGYWSEATIRTHKITKPLIWLGFFIATLGGAWYYSVIGWSEVMIAHGVFWIMMFMNGAFLTFWISPRLLARERQGLAAEILPKAWKVAVTLSFFVSILTWWGSLFLTVMLITS